MRLNLLQIKIWQQAKNRANKHKTPEIHVKANISIGDDVYIKKDKSKNKAREIYKVTNQLN